MSAPDPGIDLDSGAAPAGLNWQAILIGAGTALAVGFAVSYLTRNVFLHNGIGSMGWLMALWPLTGLVNDVLGGAVAGFLARRRGVAHGGLASLLASAAGLVITLVRLLQAHVGFSSNLRWLITMPFWMALGVAVGAGAGALAVRLAIAAPRE